MDSELLAALLGDRSDDDPAAILTEDGVRENPDLSVTVELGVPVTIGGETIDDVTLRRLNGADSIALSTVLKSKTGPAADSWLFAQLSGKSEAVFGALDMGDLMTLQKVVAFFRVRRRPRTSGKPS